MKNFSKKRDNWDKGTIALNFTAKDLGDLFIPDIYKNGLCPTRNNESHIFIS